MFFSLHAVVHGEPMDVEQLQREFPNFQAPTNGPHGIPLMVEPLTQIPPPQPIWEDDTDVEHGYWNGVMEDEENNEANVSAAPRPTNGALRLPIGPNLRVTAPRTPNTVLLIDDNEGSYSGSSDGANVNGTNGGLNPTMPITEDVVNLSDSLEQGCRNPHLHIYFE